MPAAAGAMYPGAAPFQGQAPTRQAPKVQSVSCTTNTPPPGSKSAAFPLQTTGMGGMPMQGSRQAPASQDHRHATPAAAGQPAGGWQQVGRPGNAGGYVKRSGLGHVPNVAPAPQLQQQWGPSSYTSQQWNAGVAAAQINTDQLPVSKDYLPTPRNFIYETGGQHPSVCPDIGGLSSSNIRSRTDNHTFPEDYPHNNSSNHDSNINNEPARATETLLSGHRAAGGSPDLRNSNVEEAPGPECKRGDKKVPSDDKPGLPVQQYIVEEPPDSQGGGTGATGHSSGDQLPPKDANNTGALAVYNGNIYHMIPESVKKQRLCLLQLSALTALVKPAQGLPFSAGTYAGIGVCRSRVFRCDLICGRRLLTWQNSALSFMLRHWHAGDGGKPGAARPKLVAIQETIITRTTTRERGPGRKPAVVMQDSLTVTEAVVRRAGGGRSGKWQCLPRPFAVLTPRLTDFRCNFTDADCKAATIIA